MSPFFPSFLELKSLKNLWTLLFAPREARPEGNGALFGGPIRGAKPFQNLG